MSFLTFLANDILPILRFGIITSLGVVITLFIAKLVYSISVEKGINHSTTFDGIDQFIHRFILFLKRGLIITNFDDNMVGYFDSTNFACYCPIYTIHHDASIC